MPTAVLVKAPNESADAPSSSDMSPLVELGRKLVSIGESHMDKGLKHIAAVQALLDYIDDPAINQTWRDYDLWESD